MMKCNVLAFIQVLPAVIQCLPLKEDMEENETVYTCLAQLYQANNEAVSIALGCVPVAHKNCLTLVVLVAEPSCMLQFLVSHELYFTVDEISTTVADCICASFGDRADKRRFVS